MMRECDVLVVGGGPGGLAAAKGAKEAGAGNVIVLERDSEAGGILNQCIHSGFGLIRYNGEFTGPEYAYRAIHEAVDAGVEILTSRHVGSISADKIVTAYTKKEIEAYKAKTIILATGCRERTRGNISIPGSRPAGVFTAGVVQNLINCRNVMVGKRVVILGSGDIGLIIARRLTLEGAKVLAIAEIMSEPTGLARNVSQCVYDFNIPLYTDSTVSNIIGNRKLEAVEISSVDKKHRVIEGTGRIIECDTLVLSVGLIPENEVAETVRVKLNADNSVVTDKYLQTSVSGVFACGNSRCVMDLADYVSEQGEIAGRNAVHLMKDEPMEAWDESRSNCMKKGFPDKNSVTCTICPNGCQIKWDGGNKSCSGNKCPRGVLFAQQERTDPRRILTTTVRVQRDGAVELLPVKSASPIKRKDLVSFVSEIKNIKLENEVFIGSEIGIFEKNGEIIRVVSTKG